MVAVIEDREFEETRTIVNRTFLVRRVTLGVFCAVTLVVLVVPGFPFNPVFAVPFAWLGLTVPFQWLLRRQRTLRSLQNVHAAFLAFEVIVVSYLVHRLGGVEWIGVVFYLFTVVYANFFLPRAAGLVVTGLAIGGYATVAFLELSGVIPHVPLFPRLVGPPHRNLAYVVATVVVGGVGLYVVLAFTARAFAAMYGRQRDELVRRERALGALSARLLSAQDEERRRIARKLHDELGQTLAAARWALASGDSPEADRLLGSGVDGMRSLARELRPPLLDELGLAPALRTLAERFSASTGIAVEVEVPERKLPDLVATAAFRVIQEALENARRHAQARTVRIHVEGEHGPVRGVVADDGLGFNPGRVGQGLGLSGMREWVESLGGSLEVRSARGRGTRVEFTIPCHDPGPDRR
ncbi:TPA: hypothetical protein DCY65_00445 [Candidatus Acetothermia bacterium]|nr:hypothetical protein [Candidatus Acetothermia bacterium]HAZ30032.1 hypothetical protein [Candidatus Acetothermia bacterium]